MSSNTFDIRLRDAEPVTSWKQGDVAMVTAYNRPNPYRAYYDARDETWRACEGTAFCVDEPTSLRPLVVIDPEDADQVNRLRLTIGQLGGFTSSDVIIRETQAALREFANPTPRIEEPTGLGAVVEDAEGVRFVRWALGNPPERAPWRTELTQPDHRRWEGVKAVRILSPGLPS